MDSYIGLTKDYADLLFWVDLCASKIHTLKSYAPVPQNVNILEEKVFKKLTKLKSGLCMASNSI